MTNREKVIKGLEEAVNFFNGRVSGIKMAGWMNATRNAITLLKAQEPIEPVVINGQYECGGCRYELRRDADTYCPCCGRMVKWE